MEELHGEKSVPSEVNNNEKYSNTTELPTWFIKMMKNASMKFAESGSSSIQSPADLEQPLDGSTSLSASTSPSSNNSPYEKSSSFSDVNSSDGASLQSHATDHNVLKLVQKSSQVLDEKSNKSAMSIAKLIECLIQEHTSSVAANKHNDLCVEPPAELYDITNSSCTVPDHIRENQQRLLNLLKKPPPSKWAYLKSNSVDNIPLVHKSSPMPEDKSAMPIAKLIECLMQECTSSVAANKPNALCVEPPAKLDDITNSSCTVPDHIRENQQRLLNLLKKPPPSTWAYLKSNSVDNRPNSSVSELFISSDPFNDSKQNVESNLELSCNQCAEIKDDLSASSLSTKNTVHKDISLDALRSVLHTSYIDNVINCREHECDKIKMMLTTALENNDGIAMYISGVPGSGKTLCTKSVINTLASHYKFIYLYVNAMELLNPSDIFVSIYKRVICPDRRVSPRNARNKLNVLFTGDNSHKPPVLLVIDEIDQLYSKKQEIIYDIFNWSSNPQANLIVVSIGNMLDYAERMLPKKICSRLGTNRIAFQPYEYDQIERIMEYRIKPFAEIVSIGVVPLASRRVAAISGDLRKAFDTLRLSTENAIKRNSTSLNLEDVLSVHNRSREVALFLIVENLSRHEGLVFTAAVQLVKHRICEEFQFCALYRQYRDICISREGLEPWHEYGIHSIVMKMATTRLLIAAPGKNMMLRKIKLGMLLFEAEQALRYRDVQRT